MDRRVLKFIKTKMWGSPKLDITINKREKRYLERQVEKIKPYGSFKYAEDYDGESRPDFDIVLDVIDDFNRKYIILKNEDKLN